MSRNHRQGCWNPFLFLFLFFNCLRFLSPTFSLWFFFFSPLICFYCMENFARVQYLSHSPSLYFLAVVGWKKFQQKQCGTGEIGETCSQGYRPYFQYHQSSDSIHVFVGRDASHAMLVGFVLNFFSYPFILLCLHKCWLIS